jgi:NlpC/P60 family putative phage cell wall peptidase
MSDLGAEVAQIARAWIGTPYVHQASCRGAGADCLGLLRGIWREIYGGEPEVVPAYTADWSEPSRDEVLWRASERHLVAKALVDAAIGDVLLFRMSAQGVSKHLGIQSALGERSAFVHAYARHGVIENTMSTPWQKRLVARFSFPERRG